MPKAKLRDVAERAGVSLTTASLALAGKGRISREVRERVAAAAEGLDYRQGRPGGSRSFGRPGAVRYVAILHRRDRDYEWNFVRPIILHFQSLLLEHGYVPVVLPATVDESPSALFDTVTGSGVGAVVSIHYGNAEVFARLENRGIPVIMVNNSNYQDRFFSVCVADFEGAYEGTLYLTRLGHREILYVEYARPDFPGVLADRFFGFRKALDEHGIPFRPEHRITVQLGEARELADKLQAAFSAARRPTGIFAHDDYLAAHVVSALHTMRLRVPEDVSIIAPGDVLDYREPFVPQITTMRINTALLGKYAFNLLLERLRGGVEDVHVLKVKQHLIKRGSCAKAG